MKSMSNIIVLAAWAISIAACGGGGGGGGSTPAPLMPPPLSSDASLSSLSVTGGTLDPAFSPAVTNYTATVPFRSSVDVSATTSDDNASFTINGSNNTTVALTVGDNTISIVVTAEDSATTRTYTVVVTRPLFVIDTTVGWNGAESAELFGDGAASEVFGQTFVVTAGSPTLQRLSFWLQYSPDDTSGEDLFFSVVVSQWQADRTPGSVLYESELQSITTAQSMMTEYVVDTGGLILAPGNPHIAYLSANNGFWNTTTTLIRVGFQNADVYSQGAAWSLDTDNDPNLVRTTPWMNPFGTADMVVMFSF